MALPERFSHYLTLIGDYLDRLIPPETAPPEPIYRAMRYSLFAGGKRLRPILCLAVTESLGETPEKLLPVAAAIEMIHTYSLIHDDLPSMDNDDYRRGKLTNHKVFGEAIAILAGDALLTSALETVANASYGSVIRCRLLCNLTKAAGTAGMIGGQVMDMTSENRPLDRVDLEKLHGMKTAALIAFSAVAPAMVLQSGADVEQALVQYGESIGLAYQIVDDVLDVEGRTETLGKTAGKDATQKKATYPSLIGLEDSKTLAADLIQIACNAIAPLDRLGFLAALANHVLQRNY